MTFGHMPGRAKSAQLDKTFELIDRLCDLTKGWNEHDLVPDDQKERCKEIGKKLWDIGGIEHMRTAYYEAKARNKAAIAVQCYWDGIGSWVW